MENVKEGKAAYLIDFPDIPFKEYPKKHKLYINEKNRENMKAINVELEIDGIVFHLYGFQMLSF